MVRHSRLLFGLFAAIFAGSFSSTSAVASADTPITYRVVEGDTLYALAKRYMVGPQSAEVVRRLNKVAQPTRLQAGRVLKIPRGQLRSKPVLLRIQSLSGPVTLIANGQRLAATKGAVLRQGMEIETGRKGFVAFSGNSGSLVTLPSRSHARLRSAKRYLINNALDVDLEIVNGRSSIKAPKLRQQERFRTRTPVAVSAVRGTEFRVGFDADTSLATTEVIEGAVNVSDAADAALAEAGFGVAATPAGIDQPEALLSAPSMNNPTRIQTAEDVEFSFAPTSGAKAHRVQLGQDAGFISILDDQIVAGSEAKFNELPNGRYFVRTRAIAKNGLEGLSEAHSFRRHRAGVTATVEPSPLDGGFKFAWLSQGDDKVLYGFQLWSKDSPGNLLVDELGATDTSLTLTKLEQGRYVWRVAALQMVPEGLVKVWADPQELTVGE